MGVFAFFDGSSEVDSILVEDVEGDVQTCDTLCESTKLLGDVEVKIPEKVGAVCTMGFAYFKNFLCTFQDYK